MPSKLIVDNFENSSGVVLSYPAANTTLVGTDSTQTLTNKSIVASQLTGTIAAARMPTGSVLQVVQTVLTSATQTIANQGGFVAISGLSVTITPSSASNKVLVMWQVCAGNENNQPGFALYRNGSITSFIGDAASTRARVTGGFTWVSVHNVLTHGGSYLDSPASTSAQTYAIYGYAGTAAGGTGAIYINRSSADSDSTAYLRSASSIIAMEIAG